MDISKTSGDQQGDRVFKLDMYEMKHLLTVEKALFSHKNGICRLMKVWTVNQINQFHFNHFIFVGLISLSF